MTTKTLIFGVAVVFAGSLLFFSFTNPDNLPIFLLMVPIVFIFLAGFMSVYLTLNLTLGSKLSSSSRRNFSIMAGLTLALFGLFQSSGGIVWADIIIILLLLLVSYIYISRL